MLWARASSLPKQFTGTSLPSDLSGAVIVFVPGIMGSCLRYSGEDEHGIPCDDMVWSDDVFENADTLGTLAARLRAPVLIPEKVIERMRMSGLVFQVYGPLIQWCTTEPGLNLTRGSNFFPFPYDWRQDNRRSADALAGLIDSIDPEGRRDVYLIAHSMGGLVSRLMLLQHSGIRDRTRVLFQIASPVRGSADSLWALRKHPEVKLLFDFIWKIRHVLKPDRRAELQQSLQTFASLYELLPPRDAMVLINRGGQLFPAVHLPAWASTLHAMVSHAEEVHELLTNQIKVSIECLYSDDYPTTAIIAVGGDWELVAVRAEARGDRTVMSSSALAGSAPHERTLISGGSTEHMQLCSHPQVLEHLREVLTR
jgi:pimeloyl-ACP methyl ester carboxylesterase